MQSANVEECTGLVTLRSIRDLVEDVPERRKDREVITLKLVSRNMKLLALKT